MLFRLATKAVRQFLPDKRQIWRLGGSAKRTAEAAARETAKAAKTSVGPHGPISPTAKYTAREIEKIAKAAGRQAERLEMHNATIDSLGGTSGIARTIATGVTLAPLKAAWNRPMTTLTLGGGGYLAHQFTDGASTEALLNTPGYLVEQGAQAISPFHEVTIADDTEQLTSNITNGVAESLGIDPESLSDAQGALSSVKEFTQSAGGSLRDSWTFLNGFTNLFTPLTTALGIGGTMFAMGKMFGFGNFKTLAATAVVGMVAYSLMQGQLTEEHTTVAGNQNGQEQSLALDGAKTTIGLEDRTNTQFNRQTAEVAEQNDQAPQTPESPFYTFSEELTLNG